MEESQAKREIKQGRRAGTNIFLSGSGNTTETSSEDISTDKSPSPRPTRRQGGWADDIKEKKKGGTGSDAADDEGKFGKAREEEDERLKQDNTVLLDNDTDDIPIIPELDDVTDEDLTQQVAAPPSVLVTRIATFKELDSDFEKHSGLLTLDGDIDLKLLGSVLSPESEIKEGDNVWDWDRVFTEVASELRTEWEKSKIIIDKD